MIPHFILVASLLGAQSTSLQTPQRLDDGLSELRSIRCEESLGALRAGAPALAQPIDEQERAELQAAMSSSPNLADLRAGVWTDHDMQIVLVVLVGILVLAILL